MKLMLGGPLDNSVEPNEPAHPHSHPRYTREEAMYYPLSEGGSYCSAAQTDVSFRGAHAIL